ncbi:MAG: M56 family metallopeptidase [Bacteroidia bacterium]|nr:M56 family metallopeptidase [Bacteroidia bacterium]
MIVYLITSTLLSLLGWLLYVALIRNRYSWKQQKNFILMIFFMSFLFPLIFYPKAPELLKPNPLVQPLAFGQSIDHSHLQSFCKCERPDYTHRIKYRTNAYLNLFLNNKHYLNIGIAIAVFGVILVFLLQLNYLRKLVKNSKQKNYYLNGKEIVLLFPPIPHSIGAFRLDKNYVIWQKDLDGLEEAEKRAILLHELSHIAQRDTLLKAFLRISQCFWLFNPVFYYFKRELDLLSECIADEEGSKALSSPMSYANLLVKVKEWQQAPLVQQLKGSILFTRIHRLTHQRIPNKFRNYFLSATLLVLLQGMISIPLAKQISNLFLAFETYEEIYLKVDHGHSEAIYCQDCESVCQPVK